MSAEKEPILKFKLLNPDAVVPKYAKPGDAGFDLITPIDFNLKVAVKPTTIPLGLAVEIPQNWCIQFIGRSGLASKNGVAILGGLIDSGYRGELGVVLLNTGEVDIFFRKGDKIAQGVVYYAPQAKIVEVEELSETERGSGGFGSTGK